MLQLWPGPESISVVATSCDERLFGNLAVLLRCTVNRWHCLVQEALAAAGQPRADVWSSETLVPFCQTTGSTEVCAKLLNAMRSKEV